PAGSYDIEYKICEITNPLNCDSAISTLTVAPAVIDAVADALGTINGNTGGTTTLSLINSDTLNAVQAVIGSNPGQVKIEGVNLPTGISIANDGKVVVAPNTPAGSYDIEYKICEITNPLNCDSAISTLTVAPAVIDAVADALGTINGNTGGTTTISLITNDTLNGNPIVIGTAPGEVSFTIVGTLPAGLTLNADYTITVAPNTPAANYNVEYRICENTNPTNCDSVAILVPVTVGDLVANPDAVASVIGSNTPQTLVNVLDNDTKNGAKLDPSDVTLSVSTPDPKGYLTLNPDGTVTLGANPPAGDYELTYTICEKLNAGNCKSNTVTVTVDLPVIDAVVDSITPINGSTGGTTVSLTDNDKLNGNPVVLGTNPGEVTLNIVGTLPAGLTLNVDGTITVAPNTPAANYNVEYRICENTNPTNCDSVITVVTVTSGNLIANLDSFSSVIGSTTSKTLGNIFTNDTKNGNPLVPSDVNMTVTVSDPKGYLTINPDGTVVLGANPPAGIYELTYEICEKLNPNNCSSNTVRVVIDMPVIDAVGETLVPSINGSVGGTTTDSVIAGDTLNGVQVVIGTNPGQVKLTGVNVPSGLTLNADGTITVVPNTPSGIYDVEYSICEITNPSNCDTAITKVAVNNGTLVANLDSFPSVTGSNASQTLGNIFTNDTKNGNQLVPSDVNMTVTVSDPKGYLTINPDGTVVLGANPPAGIYELTYEICEKLNPNNCSSNTVRVVIDMPVIDAVGETLVPSINGSVGGTTTDSVIAGDTLNGVQVVIGTNPGQVKLTGVNVPSGLTLNADGTITVAPNTPSGIYDVEYSICEITNPSNCDTAITKVAVNNGTLVANLDSFPSVTGSNASQTLGNIFTNDTKNGNPLVPSDVNMTVTVSDPKGYLTINPDGTVVLGANPPAGVYELTYEICEKLNPNNCSSNTVRVTIDMPVIDAVGETLVPSINGSVGGTTTDSVIAGDTLNGVQVVIGTNPGQVKLTGVNVPSGLTLNADGTITVAPNTPSGIYDVEYSICEITNPSNCDTAITKVAVNNGTLVANTDTFPSVTGSNTSQTLGNIFTNDTKNGNPLVPSDVNMTVTVSDPKGYLTINPDGTVVLGANPPAGIYELTYEICEKLNPNNCSSNTVKVVVNGNPTAPLNQLITKDDLNVTADGLNGMLEFVNVLDNDLLNGLPINPADVVISNTPQSPYFEFNSNGTVNVKPNTPGGDYTLVYQVCLKADPNICSSSTLQVFVESPSIAIVKKAVFNDENNNGVANAGETITYSFTVTNTGNVPLRNIVISDPLPGVVVSGQAIDLDVNQSDNTNFSAIYKITQSDINKGSVTNQASVKGSTAKGVMVEDMSDDSDVSGDKPTIINLNGCEIKVFNAFSPNGDKKNERFYIQGLECYPDNTVEIYNRWGVLVFDVNGYNNEDRAFRGYSEGRSTMKQSEGLPVGTYFYILKYKDSDSNVHEKSGYLYINK
ncbi:gliding motility-associated C-terminal domain-containing protein, partial [Flavobacterium sp. 17A]